MYTLAYKTNKHKTAYYGGKHYFSGKLSHTRTFNIDGAKKYKTMKGAKVALAFLNKKIDIIYSCIQLIEIK